MAYPCTKCRGKTSVLQTIGNVRRRACTRCVHICTTIEVTSERYDQLVALEQSLSTRSSIPVQVVAHSHAPDVTPAQPMPNVVWTDPDTGEEYTDEP